MTKNEILEIIGKLNDELRTTVTAKEQSGEALRRLQIAASYYTGEDRVISFEEIGKGLTSKNDEIKIFTGWKKFDEIIGGFRPQQLVVVSALTKSGKTSFLMDLTSRISAYTPLWLPYEESSEELVRKCLERGLKPPVAFSPAVMKSTNMDWIERRIVESIAKNNTRVVVIDQLDFIVPFGGDNRADRIGDTMRKLKDLARKWGVVIFLICHLQKTQMDTQPTLEDLRGSSSIGQEADTVVILWREARREKGKMVVTNNTNVSVQANRRKGTTGNVEMVYDNGVFEESDWSVGVETSKDFDF